MKKLTDKDAILCVSKEEWDSIIDLYQLKISKDDYMNFESNCINVIGIGYADKKTYKSLGYKITKASKILNKGVSKKELLRRVEKLEKVMIDNTEVKLVSQANPEQKSFGWTKMSKNITYKEKPELNKEDVPDPPPAVPTEEKPLSIREVQVKVNSQEEANECAEIAKACGEYVEEYMMSFPHSKTSLYFSVENKSNNKFGLYVFDKDLPEISIQEFRERFGNPKEIDWSKAGKLVTNKSNQMTWMTTGKHFGDTFESVVVRDLIDKNNIGKIVTTTSKFYVNILCTEPITLSN